MGNRNETDIPPGTELIHQGTGEEDLATPEALEFGRWLFAQECEFINGSTSLETIPPQDLPEIAFAGRSNVGKSSLLNALTGRKTLARASQTPGRTRQINFFVLGGRLMLADLPGYGYAEAPKHEIERWTKLVNNYFKGRASLRRACLLIDSRHGIKPTDLPLMRLLDEKAVNYQVILTKADKLSASELVDRCAETTLALTKQRAAHPIVQPASAIDGIGIPELRAALAALAQPAALR